MSNIKMSEIYIYKREKPVKISKKKSNKMCEKRLISKDTVFYRMPEAKNPEEILDKMSDNKK
jgi:hypothetical protein